MYARVAGLSLLISKVAHLELVRLGLIISGISIASVVGVSLGQVLVCGALIVYSVDAKELAFGVDGLSARHRDGRPTDDAADKEALVAVVVFRWLELVHEREI